MQNDPNVIYGGDPEGPLKGNCASLGEMILTNLMEGGDKNASVSFELIRDSTKKILNREIFSEDQRNDEQNLDFSENPRA